MIVSRTPLRISFVGGGSDISTFYRHTSGAVITTAINKYVYIMVSKQFDGRIIAQYSKMETVRKVSEIENNLIREAMKITGVKSGVHITSICDVPSEGTGMGSSSAYVVGLLNALYAYQGKHISPRRLAEEACRIEITILKKPIGKQDQYIAAFGGFRYLQFNSDESVKVNPIICQSALKKSLEKRLLLLYTGRTRSSDLILAQQRQRLLQDKSKLSTIAEMVNLAKRMRADLSRNTLSNFAGFLHQNWMLKKSLTSSISTPEIDNWYELALRHGAVGGKILGAGGGGFLLLYAEPRYHKSLKQSLLMLTQLEFGFEPQGSKIIFTED